MVNMVNVNGMVSQTINYTNNLSIIHTINNILDDIVNINGMVNQTINYTTKLSIIPSATYLMTLRCINRVSTVSPRASEIT